MDTQIHFKRNFENEPKLELLPYDSELWDSYHSAGGPTLELLKEFMEDTDNIDAFEGLCEN